MEDKFPFGAPAVGSATLQNWCIADFIITVVDRAPEKKRVKVLWFLVWLTTIYGLNVCCHTGTNLTLTSTVRVFCRLC